MSFLLDYTTGIGMPRPQMQHQIVMSHWLANMSYELRPQGYEVLTENAVIQGKGERVPDLVIYDQSSKPLAFFEIVRSGQVEKDIAKCVELMDRFPDVEYYVYDYEEDILYAFDTESNEWIDSENDRVTSQYLQKPVIEYID